MTRSGIALACACVASTTCGSVSKTTDEEQAKDRAKVEKLHRLDIAATLWGDLAALLDRLADDAVPLQQGEEPVAESCEKSNHGLGGFVRWCARVARLT
jgi:hypothetical protein